jgi:hypothetical protein
MGIACLLAAAVFACLASCTSQTFAQKTPDGQVYLNGSTSFLFFGSSFIKKCTESGTTLTCKKMTIVDSDDDDSSDDDSKSRARHRSHDDDDDSDEDRPKRKADRDDSDDSDDGSREKSSSDDDDD